LQRKGNSLVIITATANSEMIKSSDKAKK